MRYLRAANTVLHGWAALIALGVAPTLIAVVGVVSGTVGGFVGPALVVALVCSLAVNLFVAAGALQSRLRQRAYEREWAIQETEIQTYQEEEPQRPDWLPDENGNPTASNADLDRAMELASQAARTELGPGAILRASLIGLDDKTVIFDAKSRTDHKACSVMVSRSGSVNVYSKARWEPDEGGPDAHDVPLWRQDGSWINLLTESWRIERPFIGDVYLWPLAEYEKPQRAGAWRICYIQAVEGFRSEERCYVLVNGALSRHPIPDPLGDKPTADSISRADAAAIEDVS